MTIALQETLRAVFYAPLYAALSLRAYEDEGVSVRFVEASSPSDAARGVLDGKVHVTWGGPMRVILNYDRIPKCDLVCFCEVVTRDPFFLIGRRSLSEFDFAHLIGKRVATVSEVPTPWMCLQDDLRRAGLNPLDLQRAPDRPLEENIVALREGSIDVVQTFEPFVEELLSEGAGYLWYAAARRGPTSYTTLYTRRPFLEANRDELRRIVRAILRTQKWVHMVEATEIADSIAAYFPFLPRHRLVGAVERYKQLGVWGENPRLPKVGYERLKSALLSGQLVTRAVQFESAVDNSLADEAMGDDPPPIGAHSRR